MSDEFGVTAEGGKTLYSAGGVGVSSPAECTRMFRQVAPPPELDTVGVCLHNEPSLLRATKTIAVSVPKEISAPQ